MKRESLLAVVVLGASTLPLAAYAADPYQPPSGAEARQYAGDAAITAKIKSAFLAEPNLKSLDISVETTDGVVLLSGAVGSNAEIARAVVVAQRVKGVKEVKTDLHLTPDVTG